jgi:sortase A
MQTHADQANPRRRRQVLRFLEFLLLACGIAALGYCVSVALRARATAYAADAFVAHVAAGPAASSNSATPLASGEAPPLSTSPVMGRIQIPQLGLSAPITSGIGRIELIDGVGHIPGTALAGGLGTMALAGHRDTFFRPLRRIAPGMQIRVTGADGTFRYQVDSTRIVTPEQVEVLETGHRPLLVLVTCYPFHYIGAAPRRFIVEAHLVSLLPDANHP